MNQEKSNIRIKKNIRKRASTLETRTCQLNQTYQSQIHQKYLAKIKITSMVTNSCQLLIQNWLMEPLIAVAVYQIYQSV